MYTNQKSIHLQNIIQHRVSFNSLSVCDRYITSTECVGELNTYTYTQTAFLHNQRLHTFLKINVNIKSRNKKSSVKKTITDFIKKKIFFK